MPYYEFRCDTCGHIQEELCRDVDDRLFGRDCIKDTCDGTAYLIMSKNSFRLEGDWSY